VKEESLAHSYDRCLEAFELLERDRIYVNQNSKCEPQLGRRGLYRGIAGQQEKQSREIALLWVLSGSDGRQSLLDIAEGSHLPFHSIHAAAEELLQVGLLKESPEAK
jgi:aminopeptidase-like protein